LALSAVWWVVAGPYVSAIASDATMHWTTAALFVAKVIFGPITGIWVLGWACDYGLPRLLRGRGGLGGPEAEA
jgi:hypothetical protein